MDRDTLLWWVTVVFAYKRPDLLPEEFRGCQFEPAYYDKARRELGASLRPVFPARWFMYEGQFKDALQNLELLRGKAPLPRLIEELIDALLSPGAVDLRSLQPLVFEAGTVESLSRQLQVALGHAVEESLVPEVREGEWGRLGNGAPGGSPLLAGRFEHFSPEGEGNWGADTGRWLEIENTQDEVEHVQSTLGAEGTRAGASAHVAELLSGYPKPIVDLAYAVSQHGLLRAWCHEYDIPWSTARRWAAELEKELRGEKGMRLSWDDLATRCRRARHQVQDSPPRGTLFYGTKMDADSRHEITGWWWSGQMPSGDTVLSPGTAAVYWAEVAR
jgi:hypothetical protein